MVRISNESVWLEQNEEGEVDKCIGGVGGEDLGFYPTGGGRPQGLWAGGQNQALVLTGAL